MRTVLLCGGLLLLGGVGLAADVRPEFDKSDYRGTVSVHMNPWFPLDKPTVDAFGGPNVPWIRCRGEDPLVAGIRLCAEYGVTAILPEGHEPNGCSSTYRALLKAAEKSGTDMKIGMFYGFFSKDADTSLAAMKKLLSEFREDLKTNPHVLRAGGHPVMVIYSPYKYAPEEWTRILTALDAEFGRMVYLANYRMMALKAGKGPDSERIFEAEVRKFLDCFDGVSNYGSDGVEGQHMYARVFERVMKDYPRKIYEAGIHSTYTCHFNMGGLEVHLGREWRESIETYLSTNPDSVLLTNLFDHYENSLVFPCYEREDLLLRYFEYAQSKYGRGKPFRREKTPELVLANPNTIQLGWEGLDFEVLGFPIDSKATEVEVTLDLCNTSGKVLKSFPPRKMVLDEFRLESYSVPSTDFASERGIVPRLRYRWQGKERVSGYNPMTLISPSLRSYHMYWARSTRNRLVSRGEGRWTLDGVEPGGTLVTKGGQSVFAGRIHNSGWADVPNQGYAFHCVKRDWTDFYLTTDGRCQFECLQALNLPDPGPGLHFYHLEIENALGRKEQSLPIWHTDGSRPGTVALPVWKEDGSIEDLQVEAVRIPFWYYPCNRDGGPFLLDASGYGHNGSVNGNGYGGGHLGHTGYNHYHNGALLQPKSGVLPKCFVGDGKGRGCLHLSGADHITIMGGTAFPGAFTYEISVRPEELGREMGLFGSGNNQISVVILPDGHVKASRRSENESAGGISHKGAFVNNEIVSRDPLPVNKWTKIAVVYDLRKMSLYMNGAVQGEVATRPIRSHEWQNHLIVGAKCKWVWEPVDRFKGYVRNIRIYGRNLQPSEFLK